MNQIQQLQNQAINAAKNQAWDQAINFNREILTTQTNNIAALNRIGIAYVQTGNKSEAKKVFSQVLKLEKHNKIAKRHLDKLKANQNIKAPSFQKNQFIEEPGKTKTTQLHRLAGKNILDKLTVGQNCTLKPKNRFISLEVENKYIGALPEDLSFRLSRLIESGNKYSCWVRSIDEETCCVKVFLKEIYRSKKNAQTNSFSTIKNGVKTGLETSFIEKEDVPLVIISTDDDNDDNSESEKQIAEIAKKGNSLS